MRDNAIPKRYLVLCTGNRCRSQMAHGFLQHFAGNRAQVFSAGTQPKGVHPLAVEVMAERGIDISGHSSDHVDQYVGGRFDAVITVCDSAKEACPTFPGAKQWIHHSFEDPDYPEMARDDPEQFRRVFCRIRDEIAAWARGFVREELG